MEIIVGIVWLLLLYGIFSNLKKKNKAEPKNPPLKKPVKEPHILPLEGEDGIEEIIDDRL